MVVWRLDRLSRSLSELLATVSGLAAANIGFESLTEKIDTTSATGNLVFQLFAALAEFERNVISERTKAGLRAARARGKKGGRPSKLTDKQVKEVQALAKNPNISITQIARLYSVSRSTIYKAINQEKTQ